MGNPSRDGNAILRSAIMPFAVAVRIRNDSFCVDIALRSLATVCLLASIGPSEVIADGRNKRSRAPSRDRYLDALVRAPKLVTYSDEGAADATVTAVGSNLAGIVESPIPAVRDIVNLRAAAYQYPRWWKVPA